MHREAPANRAMTSTKNLRPLAELIDRCMGPLLAAQGFAASDVVLAWPEIVGERLARHTEPMRVIWPKRRDGRAASSLSAKEARSQQPATLVVRVTGAFALELQHMAPVIIERVNAHFGWRCIGQLTLRQGPISRRPVTKMLERKISEEQERAVQQYVQEIADDPLRHALQEFGRVVLSHQKR